MNVFEFFARASMATKGMAEVIRGSFLQSQFLVARTAAWGPLDQAGYVERFSHWAAVCARFNATAVSSVPLRLYAARGNGQAKARRGRALKTHEREYLRTVKTVRDLPVVKAAAEIEEVVEHPFHDLWNQPNEWSTGSDFLYLTQIFMDLCGNAYWNLEDGPLGIPAAMYVLPSQWVTIIPDPKTFLQGYLFGRVATDRVFIEPRDIVHFKTPNPKDVLYGSGCLGDMVRAHDRYTSFDEYEKSITDNRARPDAVIQYKTGKLGKEQRRELLAEWNSLFQGARNAGKTWVTDYEYDLKTIGFEPGQVAALETRKWSRLEIADAFGVPIAFLDTDQVNKANADAAHRQFARFTVTPRLRRLEAKLNHLVQRYDPRLFVCFENAIPEDAESATKVLRSKVDGSVLTINEARAELNLEPIPNGDEPLVASGRLPLSMAIEAAKRGTAAPAPGKPGKHDEPDGDEDEDEEGEDGKEKAFDWFRFGR